MGGIPEADSEAKSVAWTPPSPIAVCAVYAGWLQKSTTQDLNDLEQAISASPPGRQEPTNIPARTLHAPRSMIGTPGTPPPPYAGY